MELPEAVARVIERLEDAGYEAFAVGGCVRDSLMGRVPTDYDVTTSALPAETAYVFADGRVVETGVRHGTVTVIADGMPVEITTYRVDAAYSDGRHPDSVRFTRSLREDAARRDFTMNAIAYNPRNGLVDFFGGESDIRARVVRCVGDPETRFREDALRILRALRFSSVLGFAIDPATAAAARANAALLTRVSAERIAVEVVKLLCGIDAGRIIDAFADVLAVALPELAPMRGFAPDASGDLLTRACAVVDGVEPEPAMRFAALLREAALPSGAADVPARSAEAADAALARFKLDNATRGLVARLIAAAGERLEATPRGVRRALARQTPEVFFSALAILRAEAAASGADADLAWLDEAARLAREALAGGACLTLGALAVDGGDLLAAGVPPGRPVGAALAALLAAVVDGDVPNEREALLARAQQFQQ